VFCESGHHQDIFTHQRSLRIVAPAITSRTLLGQIMTFSEHLQTRVFEHELAERRILVVFDPEGRYEGICAGMVSETCTVINTTGTPLSSRLDASQVWQKLGADTTHTSSMLIYSRDPAPVSVEEKIANPYSAYVAMGAQFPSEPSHDFQELCIDFQQDRRSEIAQLFAGQETPTIAHIDNLATGAHAHPLLESIFKTGEPTKILKGFLVPTNDVAKALEASSDWATEMRQMLRRIFGFELNAQATKALTIRAKLWQFLLFSEFAADLPGGLPEGLSSLPTADPAANRLVTDLCEDLRSNERTREAYRDAANTIEADLNLAEECRSVSDLGVRDTFAFEEVCYLKLAATCVSAGDFDRAKEVFEAHQKSLWTDEGERQLLWRILRLSLDTLGAMKLAKAEMEHRQATGRDLVSLYTEKLFRTDMLQRELETAVLQLDEGYEEVEAIVDLVRERYRDFANRLQEELIPAVEREGWPLTDMPASADTYDSVVSPLLNNGKRVAYFLTDALRLELAQNLSDNLTKEYPNTVITPVCAQLPCVTRLAMASLIPGAGQDLSFKKVKGDLQPFLADISVETRRQRLDAFDRHLGDRVATYNLETFLEETKTPTRRKTLTSKLKPTDLLVVTSTELDSLGEGKEWMRQHMAEPLDQLLRCIRRSGELGYEVAVVATDHGFLWIDKVDAGTACTTPSGGDWVLKKRRCYIGTGDEPPGSVKYSTVAVGIPCEEPAFVVPRSIGVYKKGATYFHEGLSLQESLVGRMVIQLSETNPDKAFAQEKANLELSRKRSRVSSLIVSIGLSWPGDRSLLEDSRSEFDLVAMQGKTEVGRPLANDSVDSATGRVWLGAGQAIKVSIRLSDKIKPGPFKVKVIDIKTDKALDTLDLTFEPNVH
jgi:hypothetical protein